MRVVVTGGAGFIGSHVAEALCDRGYEVFVLDDLSTGRRENVPAAATFVEGDVRDEGLVQALFRDVRPDAVSHQAAQTSVARSVAAPGDDAAVNVLGTIAVLEAAHAAGVERFVFASTGGAIYGEVPEGRAAGVDTPTLPASPYGISKLAGEHYVRAAAASLGRTTILRYANVYGPRQDPHGEAGVVAIFSQRLLAGQAPVIFGRRTPGDGGGVRDYVYVADVVRANLAALAGTLRAPVVHVATGVGTTTAALFQKLAGLCGAAVEPTSAPPRPGDLARSVLVPSPELPAPTPLDEGLRKTVVWFRARADG